MKQRNHPLLVPFLASVLLIAPFAPTAAEIVFLRNNTTVEGRVVRQSVNVIELVTTKGLRRIPKDSIQKIKYVPLTDAEKKKLLEEKRRIQAAREAERIKLEKSVKDKKELENQLAALEKQVLDEKSKEAKARADRAAALRELVASKKMEKPAGEPISYMDFAWRSIVLPGWGHFYMDRPWFGVFYMGGTGLLLANAYVKRDIALKAKDENHKEVMINFILSAQPDLAPQGVRLYYSVDANRKLFTVYQKKVNDYNYSLYLLEVFYAIQLVHVIYNGIAWETGLLVVDRNPETGTPVGLLASVGPDPAPEKGRTGTSAILGLTFQF